MNSEDNNHIQEDIQNNNNRLDRDYYMYLHGNDKSNRRLDGLKGLSSNNNSSNNQQKNNSNKDQQKILQNQKLNNLNNKSNGKNNDRMKKKLASAALTTAGVPKPASDYLAQKGTERKNLNGDISGQSNLSFFDKLFSNKKSETKDKASDKNGDNLSISLPELKKIGIIAAISGTVIVVFCCLIITSSNVYMNAIKLYHASSASNIEESINSMSDEEKSSGVDEDEDAYIDLNNNLDIVNIARKVKKYKKSDLKDLEDFYPEIKNYTQDENINDLNPVINFFYKLKDISEYYEKNYNVSLDLPLLMATLNLQSNNSIEVFEANAKNYKPNKEKNIIESLFEPKYFDYEYNWEKYEISLNNSEHDIEVLVQHMVNKDEEGNYYIDDDKYKDFLRYFIEKKYYLDSSSDAEYDNPEPDKPTEKDDDKKKDNNRDTNISNKYASAMIDVALNEYNLLNGRKSGYKFQSAFGTGSGTPWCAIFAWYVSSKTTVDGVSVYPDLMNYKSASTGAYMRKFMSSDKSNMHFYYNDSCSYYTGKNGSKKYTPKPGDFVFFEWGNLRWTPTNDVQDHTGLVREYKDGKLYTIEGNISGTIMLLNRGSLSDCRIVGFGSWY